MRTLWRWHDVGAQEQHAIGEEANLGSAVLHAAARAVCRLTAFGHDDDLFLHRIDQPVHNGDPDRTANLPLRVVSGQ